MNKLCFFLLLFIISCGGTQKSSSSRGAVAGSYTAGTHSLDLSPDGYVYWQKVRADGDILGREGRWKTSGNKLYLKITNTSVMRGQTELVNKSINKKFSGKISGNCIRLKSKTYCK